VTPAAVEAAAFDARYAAEPDPWGYDSSPYELGKYVRTLSSLGERRFGAALEIGCSNGAFTARLAPRCERLLGIDYSAEAVRLAAERVGGREGVAVERRDIRDGVPAGPWDLIVCSEVLYYWDEDRILEFLRRAEDALEPDGSLLVVSWRGRDPEAPLDGPALRDLLRAETRLAHGLTADRPGYLVDRWDASPA
jgi:SAM-dependent methyltransferase